MILRAEHLVKQYKARTVVNDMSLSVAQGEIVGLLGPNGAGKTTCFYMMVGMVKPNGGRIFLDEEEVSTSGRGGAWATWPRKPACSAT
jgi:lipopolysaccharide export system ATP-binding protein